MVVAIVPHFGDPQRVGVGGIERDDVGQAAGHPGRAFAQTGQQCVALAGFGDHLADQAVAGLGRLRGGGNGAGGDGGGGQAQHVSTVMGHHAFPCHAIVRVPAQAKPAPATVPPARALPR